MKRSTWVMFAIFAAIFVIGLPLFAITREGGGDASDQSVSSNLENGKELFSINCGSCHTLAKAGTDGVVGPNLDDRLAPAGPTPPDPATIKPRVLSAIDNGIEGRMPADILSGEQAQTVADFVSQTAGR
jgi:mono/diheme cytochrome c family protein